MILWNHGKINILAFLLIMLFFSSCFSTRFKNPTENIKTPAQFKLNRLECKELSENIHRLSTKNDEVLILYFEVENNTEILNSWISKILVFDKDNMTFSINKTISIKSIESKLLIILVEQDTERKESEIFDLVRENLIKNSSQIEKSIIDDDLLGIKELNLKSAYRKENKHLRFWGIHLFDEYEYYLFYSMN